MAQDTALQVIELQQLPIIVERLHSVKADIERRTAEATSLICTEETYKSVKDARAQLTKEFKEYEAQRTAIKSKILEPYKLHQEKVLDVEIKKHREKRSLSANAYFHVLCNKISAETGESEDAVKRRLVVSYGALARDKDGKPVGLKLPPTVDPSDFYPYVRLYETRQENGKDYSCYFVYKESHKMDSKEFARLVDGAIEEAKELGIQTDTPEQLARYKEEWSK